MKADSEEEEEEEEEEGKLGAADRRQVSTRARPI